jgi:hypothetical protein
LQLNVRRNQLGNRGAYVAEQDSNILSTRHDLKASTCSTSNCWLNCGITDGDTDNTCALGRMNWKSNFTCLSFRSFSVALFRGVTVKGIENVDGSDVKSEKLISQRESRLRFQCLQVRRTEALILQAPHQGQPQFEQTAVQLKSPQEIWR